MDEAERKKYPSLPPDYVSLAQLQERWLKKQQEMKVEEEKQAEEKGESVGENQNHAGVENDGFRKIEIECTRNGRQGIVKQLEEKGNRSGENQNHRDTRNDGHERFESRFSRNGRQRKVKEGGRNKGTVEIEGKGKEKMIETGAVEDREEKKITKKKHGKSYSRKKQVSKSELVEGDGGEMEKNWCVADEVIFTQEDAKVEIMGIGEGGTGKEGCQLDGKMEIGNVCDQGVLLANGAKEKTANMKTRGFRGGFRRNGDKFGPRYENKEYRALKLGEVSEVEVAVEKKVEYEQKKGKDWTRGRNKEKRGELKENRNTIPGLKGDVVEGKPEMGGNEILEAGTEIEGSISKERERNVIWRQRNNLHKRNKEHRFQRQGLNDGKMTVEKKIEVENIVVESTNCDKEGKVGNGLRGCEDTREVTGEDFGQIEVKNLVMENAKSDEEGKMGNGRRLYENRREIARKAFSQVEVEYLVEAAKVDEEGKVGNGQRTHENWREDARRDFGRVRFRDNNTNGRRRYAYPGRFQHMKMKQGDGCKMWVKKEEKSDANSDEVGC